jgi:hypothetical protein
MNIIAIRRRLAVLVGGVGGILMLTGPWVEDWDRVLFGFIGVAIAALILPSREVQP